MNVNIPALIILVVLILIVLWIIRDRSGGQKYGTGAPAFLVWILWTFGIQYVLLHGAVALSLNLLQDFIHISMTFVNTWKIATSIYLVYLVLSLKMTFSKN